MRCSVLIFAGLLIGGCAAQPAPEPPQYTKAVSTALVFDPPIARSEPRIDLPREPRERGALLGYQETLTTFFYLRTDDRQSQFGDQRFDRYERHAVSERVGVSYR